MAAEGTLKQQHILVIGGGIGGLTAAIALRRDGHAVDVIERDPSWTVYGVGIIQQGNVVRAMKQLDLLDDYLGAAFGYDHVEVFIPTGQRVARIPTPTLVEGYPANVGIGRPALHKVLGDRTIAAGATVRLGVTAEVLDDDGDGVTATFSDGTTGRYDMVVGADGLYSATRAQILPDAPGPEYTGQAVWRHNFARSEDVTGLCAYEGPIGLGLVPLSDEAMYIFVTTPEPDNPWRERKGLAKAMRETLARVPAPAIRTLAEQIIDDEAVVYKPLEWLFLTGDWHRGRIVLIGDAVHATTPHLGQGAGMAIEDSVVLAEEIAAADTPEAAFNAFRGRRYDRCRYIVDSSLAICLGQLGKGPMIENATATRAMFTKVAEPI